MIRLSLQFFIIEKRLARNIRLERKKEAERVLVKKGITPHGTDQYLALFL